VSINKTKGGCALLLQGLETRNLAFVGFEQGVTVNIGECWGKVEHLLFGEIQTIPKFLEAAAGILHEEVQVLPLQFVQACQLFFEFVDSSEATTTVGGEECLSITFLHPKAFPETLHRIPELLQLALAAALLLQQLLPLSYQASQVGFMEAQLFRGLAVVLNDVRVGLHLGSSKLSPELDNLLAGALDEFEPSVVFFVDSCEFVV
jgi:hypothetical protein